VKITDKQNSPEPCEEAGWVAYDYALDAPLRRGDILRLRPLGAFAYLDKLRQPFFKVESDHYLVKGLEGKQTLRVGVHRDHLDELRAVEAAIEGE
jgi:hypothetical protein